MNGTTLKALRMALGYTQQEAADMIGAVQLRTWRYWEDENRRIPDDVQATVRELVAWKWKIVNEASAQIERLVAAHGEPESVALTYYSNLDDWMTQESAEPIQWRAHQMAMAALAEQFPFVCLVQFKPVEYQAWLAGRRDDSATRAAWAAEQ